MPDRQPPAAPEGPDRRPPARHLGSAPDPRTDRELLADHVNGDPEAFGEIVRRNRDRLWSVAFRTLADREEAADAVQEALLSAYRGAASFRGDAAVTTWLHRIVVNACLDRVRRQAARRTVPLPADDRGQADPHDQMADSDVSTDVFRALARLPAEQRAALVLVDVQGYPVQDAAEILQVPVGTVKSRCARGRARLAELLGHMRPAGNRTGSGAVVSGAPHLSSVPSDPGPSGTDGRAGRGVGTDMDAEAGGP